MENTDSEAIYIGLGANLPHPRYGSPQRTLEAALADLARRGLATRRLSPWYRTAPVPASDQPWYVNAVAEIAPDPLNSDRSPDAVLADLHAVEDAFGRVRSVPNAARFIDLDLLDYQGKIAPGGPGRATLPHPRLGGRAFVLRPLADLAPGWRHPVTGASISSLIAALPTDQLIERSSLFP